MGSLNNWELMSLDRAFKPIGTFFSEIVLERAKKTDYAWIVLQNHRKIPNSIRSKIMLNKIR